MPDAYTLSKRFNKFLRVTDVTDGLDAVGRADRTLLDPAIRPLWMGCRFWGPAVDDKKARRRLYDWTGRTADETVDWESAAEFYKDLL